jgi:isopenicillin N synthase-like dioxygenase
MKRMNAVPVIDLAPFLEGSTAGRARVVDGLARAAEEIGFFSVVGHGVPAVVMDQLYARAHEFFALPPEEKQRVAPPTPAYARGYKAIGFEALAAGNAADTPPDLKEYWHFGREDLPQDAYYTGAEGRKHFFRNLWPARPAGFREAADTYYRAMEGLSVVLCRISALALGLPEHYFDDKIDRHITAARINFYPRQENPPAEGQLRAGAHTDYGMLTILSGEPARGLQVLTRSGQWVDVATDKYRFVCNIGDLLMRWTNDRWVSNTHRVLNPPREVARTSSRMSIAFFHHPNYDARIECIPGCAGDAPPKYEPVLSGEFRDYKYRVTRAGTSAAG